MLGYIGLTGMRRYKPGLPVFLLAGGLLGPAVASSQTPQGWLLVRGDSVQLALMGSCWEEGGKRVCADTWYMFRNPDSLELESAEVGPGEALRVTFSLEPTDATIMPYNGRNFEPDTDLDPSRFSGPTTPGTHY